MTQKKRIPFDFPPIGDVGSFIQQVKKGHCPAVTPPFKSWLQKTIATKNEKALSRLTLFFVRDMLDDKNYTEKVASTFSHKALFSLLSTNHSRNEKAQKAQKKKAMGCIAERMNSLSERQETSADLISHCLDVAIAVANLVPDVAEASLAKACVRLALKTSLLQEMSKVKRILLQQGGLADEDVKDMWRMVQDKGKTFSFRSGEASKKTVLSVAKILIDIWPKNTPTNFPKTMDVFKRRWEPQEGAPLDQEISVIRCAALRASRKKASRKKASRKKASRKKASSKPSP